MELRLVLCCVHLHSGKRLDTHQYNGHSAPGSQGGRCTGRSLPSSDRCLADMSLAGSDTHQYLWRRKEEEFNAREEVECSLRSLANICRWFWEGEGTNLFRGSFGPKGKAETLEHRGSKGRKDCLFLLGLWTWREAGSKIYKPLAGSLQDFHASIRYICYLLFHKFPVFKTALPWTIVSLF